MDYINHSYGNFFDELCETLLFFPNNCTKAMSQFGILYNP